MALLKILALTLLFAFCRRVHVGAAVCQLCISTADITKSANDQFANWNKLVYQSGDLCKTEATIAGGIKNEDAANKLIVTAHLQVLVYNPTHCYFQFMFDTKVSDVNCLVSGYNISGGHFTHGHCTAVGEIPTGKFLTVKIPSYQSPDCQLRANNFLCLSAHT